MADKNDGGLVEYERLKKMIIDAAEDEGLVIGEKDVWRNRENGLEIVFAGRFEVMEDVDEDDRKHLYGR